MSPAPPAPELGEAIEETIEDRVGRRIREARRDRGLSARQVAGASGVGVSTLYKIEAGTISPTVATLVKIARALGSSVAELTGESRAEREVVLFRPPRVAPSGTGDRQLDGTGFSGSLVAAGLESPRIFSVLIDIEEGGSSGSEPMRHEGEELVVCLRGRVEYRVGERTFTLGPHAALQYKAHLPHTWRNVGRGTCRVLVAMTPPPLPSGLHWHGTG